MLNKKPKKVYLDHAATTQIDASILSKMYEYDRNFFANPSSIYSDGDKAKSFLEENRKKLALAMQARQSEIYFCMGGTEANNISIVGVIKNYKKENKDSKPHVIISSIEHASVLDTVKSLENEGVEVTIIKPKKNGIVRALDFIDNIKENTVLISLMYANNEIGTVQPVGNLGKLIREYRTKNKTIYPYLHTDACQAGNYLLVTAPKLKADIITVNSSKVYGPKGIAAIYIKNNTKIEPIIVGGGQEKGIRSGTENNSLILGLVESFTLAQKMREQESKRLKVINEYAVKKIEQEFLDIKIWGDIRDRLPNNISLNIPGISAEELVIRLSAKGIYASSKSACSSVDTDGSYVILEIGGTEKEARETLRITMGRTTEKKDIDFFLLNLKEILTKYKK